MCPGSTSRAGEGEGAAPGEGEHLPPGDHLPHPRGLDLDEFLADATDPAHDRAPGAAEVPDEGDLFATDQPLPVHIPTPVP